MNYAAAEQYAKIHGDAFYLYDEARLVQNYERLLASFRRHYRGTHIAYSYKTNYTPAICRRIDALGGYAEVVSAMEYSLARRLGVTPERIVYNGPWKSDDSLREALTAGSIVNLDSTRDLQGLLALAAEFPGRKMAVGLRCNFPLKGHPDSRFGFDTEGAQFREALAAIDRLPNVTLAGLHCHFPHRDLASFIHRTEAMVQLARRVFGASAPRFLSIGGGFFGNMPLALKSKYAGEVPSFEDYARAVGEQLAAAYPAGEAPILFVEPGTALVADTFRFVARVVDIKDVRGKRLACVAGSIFNISPYARSQNLPVQVLQREAGTAAPAAAEAWDIVGYTCIEGDVLSKSLPGPLAIGDFLVFDNVGSYSIVMKPPFILPSVPILLRSDESDGYRVVKRAESFDYIFENFIF
jgi:diaminopimelate decarboxylase